MRSAQAFVVATVLAGAVTLAAPAAPTSVHHDHSGHDHRSLDRSGHDHAGHDHGAPGGHQHDEGLVLAAQRGETTTGGTSCAPDAPVRDYDVVALAVDMTMNRYLDHDPEGRMYALAGEVDRIREEEAANAAARDGDGDGAVSIGLQGDAIQPLTLRVRPGECLTVRLTNDLEDEPASFHVHGSSMRVSATGAAATAANPDAYADPGETVTYEWMVPASEPEGTHYAHSHGDPRVQAAHGLFGAVIVEPPGSTWEDPRTGAPTAGWDAVVRLEDGSSFREVALYYHEVGDETYHLLDGDGEFVPQVDPLTSAYRPAARALNYRSEPFLNRLAVQQALQGRVDESVEYSSYSFGDPATPVIRAYLGEPVKQRVIHAGPEVFHVHHVHGGSVRWPRQPGAEPGEAGERALDKRAPLVPEVSERTDSQSLGPSETFDVEPECAGGGCQAVAGDFMYHCHVAHHYFAGMWGIWRTYNTLQEGSASTDVMPPLPALPDGDDPLPAVTSADLLGRTVNGPDGPVMLNGSALGPWVERQLPPRGVPAVDDAAVWDWSREGDLYLGEPEDTAVWPGYASPTPGQRPPLLFDPRTGKLAYPFLRPHLARRPPFAPGHGPAPFADPPVDPSGVDPPAPGAWGETSLCPSGTRPRTLPVNAVRLPITINAEDRLLDSRGAMYVLRSQLEEVQADPSRREPLTIRTNASEDCVDVVLRSELSDNADSPYSKVGLHIHFVQFDVQASDGVNVGFNYEQTVRPFRAEGRTLTAAVPAGASELAVDGTDRLHVGTLVGVGLDQDERFEVRRVTGLGPGRVTVEPPLQHAHDPGEVVGTEFVRYRWFPDVQFGTAYFHDHVDALDTWRHGLFGALIAEPPGATWTHPRTGEPLESGTVADVHTDRPVSVDVSSSFRELALFTQDDQPLTHVGRSDGSSFNLRAEPLDTRGGDPSMRFNTATHADPETPLLETYVGDPIVVRHLIGGSNEVHTWHLDGHWFRIEPWSRTSRPTSTAHLGISERYDLVVPAAGGPQRRAGDYLYYSGRATKMREGAWGIVRVLAPGDSGGPRPLPGREPVAPATGSVCPADAPIRRFDVEATGMPLPMLDSERGEVFVLAEDRAAVEAGERPVEPLVLRVGVGDCISVRLTNRLLGPVSMHPDQLAFDPATDAGVAVGRHRGQAVPPGGQRTYTWYASPEVGETVALLRDWGDVLVNPRFGLYGAIVVGPAGAEYRDPVTGEDLSGRASWRADVIPPDGDPYRDYALFFQDEDEAIGSHRMPYTKDVRGTVAVNYLADPPDGRSLAEAIADGTATPVLEAHAGDAVRLHVLAPWSEQAQVFSIEGHRWPMEPGRDGTPLLSAVKLGGLEALTLFLEGGAGGPDHLPGDYMYGNHRLAFADAGQWGVLRVYEDGDGSIRRLDDGGGGSFLQWALLSGGLAGGVGLAGVQLGRRRRRLRLR